jgi:DNA-directed RNA polymerase subunit E'/Rpb7
VTFTITSLAPRSLNTSYIEAKCNEDGELIQITMYDQLINRQQVKETLYEEYKKIMKEKEAKFTLKIGDVI